MDFGGPLPNLVESSNTTDLLAAAQEAGRKAHEAVMSAGKGRTVDATAGNIFVTNAIFANLLKQHQGEIDRLTTETAVLVKEREQHLGEIARLKKELTGYKAKNTKLGNQIAGIRTDAEEVKKQLVCSRISANTGWAERAAFQSQVGNLQEQLKLKQIELDAAAKTILDKADHILPRKYCQVVFHRAGYSTIVYALPATTSLQEVLYWYAELTKQELGSLMVIGKIPACLDEVVDPAKVSYGPEEQGPGHQCPRYSAYEVIKIKNLAAKREASTTASDTANKKQKT